MTDEIANTIYFLNIEDNGRPKIKSDQILTCEHHTSIHIELLNGTPITNEISLVSNAKDNFPFGLLENERKNGNVDRTKFTQFIFEPIESNTIITYEIKLDKSGPVEFAFIYFDKMKIKIKLQNHFILLFNLILLLIKKELIYNQLIYKQSFQNH